MNGPPFLSLSEERWPKGKWKLQTSNQQKEETSAYNALQAQASSEEFILLSKYSSLTGLLRATAYTLRFIYNCKCQRTGRQIGPLLVKELECARKFWIGTAQVEYFPLEITRETSTPQIKVRLASLSSLLDGDEIACVGG